jgi:hypothetical protein
VGIFNVAVNAALGAATGGPVGALGGAVAGAAQERAKTQSKRAQQQQREAIAMMRNIPDPQYFGSQPANPSPVQPVGFFEGLGTGLGALGTGIGDFFTAASPLTSLFGINTGLQRTNAGTALTINNQRPQETAQSGEILGANLGMAPALFQTARNLLRTPGGQTALGFGAGALGAALGGGSDGKPRITRRMKSDVRRIYMMAGMDPNMTASILNNMGTYPRIDFNASLVFFILTKRFRNDGPVVTKAAVRKTKTTLRRMKGVVDMYNFVCKPAPRRTRAAPSRAKAVQLISNK